MEFSHKMVQREETDICGKEGVACVLARPRGCIGLHLTPDYRPSDPIESRNKKGSRWAPFFIILCPMPLSGVFAARCVDARQRGNRLRRSISIIFMDVDDTTADITAVAAVQEIHQQADECPTAKEHDALRIEAEEQIDTARNRQRRNQPDDRRAERTLTARVSATQHENSNRHGSKGKQGARV